MILGFFCNLLSKTQLGIVLWSYLCSSSISSISSITVFVPWWEMMKKGLFSTPLLSKISSKGENNTCQLKELNPSLLCERLASKPINHQVTIKKMALNSRTILTWVQNHENLWTEQEFGTFYLQFPLKKFPNVPTSQIFYCVTKCIQNGPSKCFQRPWQKKPKMISKEGW